VRLLLALLPLTFYLAIVLPMAAVGRRAPATSPSPPPRDAGAALHHDEPEIDDPAEARR
jgi:hypothetical protein